MSTNKEKELEKFLLHIDCLNELKPWLDNFNIFDVLKLSRAEIRHSNMLSWLLNPSENHGLNDLFLRNLIKVIIQNNSYSDINPIELLTVDFSDLQVLREWENIDIFLSSKEYVIVIENKIDSQEHDNQLQKYKKIVDERYKKQKKLYLYLTPSGIAPSDDENWLIVTYSDILEALQISFDLNQNELPPGPKMLIQDYINLLRSKIVEDPKLIEICKKIYIKYKPALDLIFENKGNFITENVIQEIKDNNIMVNESSSTNSVVVFSTNEMNDILPALDEKKSGSWNDGLAYHYWIKIENERLFGCFELGGWGLTESIKAKQNLIIENSPNRKARKDEDFKYKRVFTTKKITVDPDSSESIRKAVKNILNEIFQNEKKVTALFK